MDANESVLTVQCQYPVAPPHMFNDIETKTLPPSASTDETVRAYVDLSNCCDWMDDLCRLSALPITREPCDVVSKLTRFRPQCFALMLVDVLNRDDDDCTAPSTSFRHSKRIRAVHLAL